MIIDSVYESVRMIIVGTTIYVVLILLLRSSGKRTLSKLNAFDFIITVALGSTVATILLSSTVSLIEGITAVVLLITLQLIITWISVRIPWFRNLITANPVMVFKEGHYLEDSMKRARITKSELLQAARKHGVGSMQHIHAIVLETSGELSVITEKELSQHSSLSDVKQ